jgi:serine/threonine protein kinase
VNEALWQQFVGQSVERSYAIRELLGTGSFGGVFRGEHLVAGQLVREVAIKLIAADEQYLKYQLPELVIGTNLSHPNIVRCYSAGEIELNRVQLLYLIVELAQEGSLEDRLKAGPMSSDEVEDLAFQVASGLSYLQPRS